MKTLLSLLLLLSTATYACPELQGIDMASEEDDKFYEVVSSAKYEISPEELKMIPEFSQDWYDYADCKDALRKRTLVHKASGKTFVAIVSVEDSCDGGNTVGNLYDVTGTVVLGSVGDSQISCNK